MDLRLQQQGRSVAAAVASHPHQRGHRRGRTRIEMGQQASGGAVSRRSAQHLVSCRYPGHCLMPAVE